MYTARDTPTSAVDAPLAEVAYRSIKNRLLAGDFRLGDRLAETAIAEELGVSRTPVREALSRLHVEGLVVRLDSGGYGPSAPDLHTVNELYEVRRGLELMALDRGSHDSAALESLRDDWADLDPDVEAAGRPEFVLMDEEFHLRLADAAGNRALVELLLHVNERIRLVRSQDFLTADRVATTIVEHLGIVTALLAGEDAAALLKKHLEISGRIVERRAAIALSRMVSSGRRDPSWYRYEASAEARDA